MHICSAQGWQAAVHLGSFFVGGLGDESTAWFVFFHCQIETKHTDGNGRRDARWKLSSQCSKRELDASISPFRWTKNIEFGRNPNQEYGVQTRYRDAKYYYYKDYLWSCGIWDGRDPEYRSSIVRTTYLRGIAYRQALCLINSFRSLDWEHRW